ncbi:MAG: YraN family protein [Pseudomonadota bacterium]
MTDVRQPGAGSSRARAGYERGGRTAEWLAAGVLLLKGYRILECRARTSAGEIDIVAVRGRRIAFVEVKRRPTLAHAATAVAPSQQARLHRAADAWVARYTRYRHHTRGFDRFEVARLWRFRHVIDALEAPR